MKYSIMVLAFLALLLAGCEGDIASPTTTTTTTTTTTAAAELAQDHNKAVCVGLLNIGSCNTTQTSVQTVRPARAPAPAPNQGGMGLDELLSGLTIIFIAFFVLFVGAALAMGTRQ
jgi:hypothetical protein